MAENLSPTIDYIFKRLFGGEDNAPLLVDQLNAVVNFPATRMVRGVLLLNPFVAQDYVEGKVPVLDIRVRDDPGRQFLVEMQLSVRGSFAQRMLYYWAGAHAEQLLKGEAYELLLPTYMICWVNETLFPDAAYHHCFRVYDDEHEIGLCKDLEIHVIELTKFAVPVEAVQTQLERWCYFLKHGASLDLDHLPATLDVPVIRKAVEVLMKLSQDERERQWALERQRAERDAADLIASAKNARQWGFDEGFEKGKLIGRVQLLQQLLKQPEKSNEELNRLSEDQLLQLEDSLQQQLSGKKDANGTPPANQSGP